MTEQLFDIADVISTGTGVLIGKIDGVYQVCNFMTGESVFTHQLPRIGREAKEVLRRRHDWFDTVLDEAEQVTPENYKHWIGTWRERYVAISQS